MRVRHSRSTAIPVAMCNETRCLMKQQEQDSACYATKEGLHGLGIDTWEVDGASHSSVPDVLLRATKPQCLTLGALIANLLKTVIIQQGPVLIKASARG